MKNRGQQGGLAELEDWLTAQLGIVDAAVLLQPIDPSGEPRLAAFVKVEPGQFKGVAALRMQMQSDLIASMQPAAITVVENLPRARDQKIDCKVVEDNLSHVDISSEASIQADGIIGQVTEIWAKVLNRGNIGPGDNFFDLGGDSIGATVAAAMIEEWLGVTVDTGFAYRVPMLAEQASALEYIKKTPVTLPDRLLVPLTSSAFDNLASDSGPTRVLVISGAGGHVLPFAPLAEELLPEWELVGILHPCILEKESTWESIEAVANRMLQAMKALQPNGPYFIVGYSYGGAVGHEMGQHLSEAGEKAGVIIVDLPVPKRISLRTKANLAKREFRQWVRRALAPKPLPHSSRLHHVRHLNDTNLDPTERARLAVAFDHMGWVLMKYRPKKSTSPTVLIKAAETGEHFSAADFDWHRFAPLEQIVVAPGNHLNLFKGQNLSGFADLMRTQLTLLKALTDANVGPQ